MKLFLFLLIAGFSLAAPQERESCEVAFATVESTTLSLSDFSRLRAPEEEILGDNHLKIYYGALHGRDVFLKVSFAKQGSGPIFEKFAKEAHWVRRLSDLGIGPKYRGVVKTPEGFAVVTDLVRGSHVGHPRDLEAHLSWVNDITRSDLKKIREFIKKEGIMPLDFQMRISPDGHLWVIDPAFFLQKGEDVPTSFSKTGIEQVEKYFRVVGLEP